MLLWLKIEHQEEPPLLTGKDFLDVIQPGPQLGELVKKAYELQLDGMTDKDALKREVLSWIDEQKNMGDA